MKTNSLYQQAKAYADEAKPAGTGEDERQCWHLCYKSHLDGLREGSAQAAGEWSADYQTFIDGLLKRAKS